MPHVIVDGALAWKTDAELEAAKATKPVDKADKPKSKPSTILKA